jgi:hypothetical protein
MNIYKEFIDLSDSADVQYECNILREITRLKCKLIKVEKCLQGIATIHDSLSRIPFGQMEEYYTDMVSVLRKMNFRYKFDINSHNSLVRDISLTQSRSKQWSMEVAILEREQEAYRSKQSGGTVDRVYFTQALIRIGQWYGGGVLKAEVLTVAEYCQLKNQYVEYVNRINKENAKR